MDHEAYMSQALELAREAASGGDVPVGCVIVRDEKDGCCGSVLNLFEERFNHRPRVYQGPLKRECEAVLQEFFQKLR